MSNRKRFILSVDGGGMRGLIAVRVLESLMSRVAHNGTPLPAYRLFDLMCGTSTGGLVAAGLAAPCPTGARGKSAMTLAELRSFFEEEARDIFMRRPGERLERFVANPLVLFDRRYDARPFELSLKARFGWTSMRNAMTGLILPTYDLERRKVAFLSNMRAKGGPDPDDFYMWQAVRAATAAPSYFAPAEVENLTTKRQELFIDSSPILADPAMSAYIEALKLGWAPEDIVLLSLGTGRAQNAAFSSSEARNWGILGWFSPQYGNPLLKVLTDGQAQIASYQAKWLFGEGSSPHYIRISGIIPPSAEDFDNVRPGNVAELNVAADRIIRDHTVVLDDMAEMLSAKAGELMGKRCKPRVVHAA